MAEPVENGLSRWASVVTTFLLVAALCAVAILVVLFGDFRVF